MKFSLKTDWSKVQVEQDGSVYHFERLEHTEVGCDNCGGYADWRVISADNWLNGIIECNNCLLADATSPDHPGTFSRRH